VICQDRGARTKRGAGNRISGKKKDGEPKIGLGLYEQGKGELTEATKKKKEEDQPPRQQKTGEKKVFGGQNWPDDEKKKNKMPILKNQCKGQQGCGGGKKPDDWG